MGRVTLRFTPQPEHVRTARLVAVAVARRAGMADDVLERLRLAVGEACARAVSHSRLAGEGADVELCLDDGSGRLDAAVLDPAPATADADGADLAMTLVAGLADEAVEETAPHGATRLRMAWNL